MVLPIMMKKVDSNKTFPVKDKSRLRVVPFSLCPSSETVSKARREKNGS